MRIDIHWKKKRKEKNLTLCVSAWRGVQDAVLCTKHSRRGKRGTHALPAGVQLVHGIRCNSINGTGRPRGWQSEARGGSRSG